MAAVENSPSEPGSVLEAPAVERIGKYEVVGLLGKGGMGAVYRAFDPFLEREVALKVMLPQIAEDPEQKQRFEREARAVARLTHTNVVTVFDLGYHTDGAPYIVMELLQGQDLLDIAKQDPTLSLEKKVSIVLQVLDGLGQAHRHGIVHRDIKPANVFIVDDGTAKIMDFGIARLGSGSVTSSEAILGTANYMSPEQVAGDQVDGRSDLFAVGSMLCELLSGRRPFDAETPVATLYRIAHKGPTLELPKGPEYEQLLPVLERALAKDPSERYATSAEFAEALAECVDAESPTARRSARPGRGEGPTTATTGKIKTTRPFAPGVTEAPTTDSGEGADTPPPDPTELFRILRDVYVGGKSGHLHSTSRRSCRSLRVLKGQITHAISDTDGEHLGEVFVRYGVIKQSDLERALETEKRLGPVLSGMGLLDKEGLEKALGLHVREILFAMLEEPDGAHSFEELHESASESEVTSGLSTGQVILEATRRVLDPDLVRQVLGDMDRTLALSDDPVLGTQQITLTPTDGFVLSRIDGSISAHDVVGLSPVPAADAERSLFGLLCTGIVDYRKKEPTSRTRPHLTRTALRRREDAAGSGVPTNTNTNTGTDTDTEPKSRPTEAAPRETAAAIPSPKAPSTTPPAPPGGESTPAPISGESTPAPPSSAVESPPVDMRSRETPRPASSPPKVEAADTDPAAAIREAEGLFASGQYKDVIDAVEPLVSHVEGALKTRASILLARGCMKDPKRHDQAESVLLELVSDDPKCSPAYLLLGALYRSGNQTDRARGMYEKVLELEPRHRGAAAELAKLGAAPAK